MTRRFALLAVGAALALTPACTLTPSATATPHSPAPQATTASTSYADSPTYHGDSTRSGYAITVKHISQTPTLAWSLNLDGAVYGQPIVVDHGITIVATEDNSVYRLSNNAVVWRTNLGAPVPRSALPCGDIDPTGITGTPTYDAATNTVVVVSLLNSPIRHIATGLDPVTGAVRWSRNVDVPNTAGITPAAMQERGALNVVGRRVYIPYGGLAGDCSSYRGSVVGVDLDHPTTAGLFSFTVPTSREGGIWGTPGVVENPGGGLLAAVGNGATAGTGTYDYSDSVLKIATQRIVDSFSPSTWRTDNANDLDLGSQGPQIVGNYVFIAGKSGTGYVLDRAKLGGIGGQVSSMSLCKSFGGAATVGNEVFVPCTDGVRAVRINSNGSMTVLWHAASNITGSPTAGAGYIWSLDTGAGMLHALNPATGASVYSLAVGSVNRFAAPTLYAGAVFVGTLSGIKVYHW
ncbi:MAG TPA: PQQ-binding-like beta-propeller repeat protein [Jatrophihabitans sp.]|nr:PQQ-binding-like beta-propeller repeat protein [Jatrophihabitans sp.]